MHGWHTTLGAGLAGTVILIGVAQTRADDIPAKPGEGSISAATAAAKPGDRIILDAGEYRDQVKLPEGVTLRGAGADKTILIATGYAAISTTGRNTIITGLEIRAGDKTTRGINSSLPVRVEWCRFRALPEAVALADAPLSDVVRCEFVDCRIGVRAIGGSSPTVWGCLFRDGAKGSVGVFALDGSPYIRNNLFADQDTGLRLVVGESGDVAIIRNNVFLRCRDAAVTVMPGKSSTFGPSVRNNLAAECGALAVGPEAMLTGVTHWITHKTADPLLRTAEGAAIKADNDQRRFLAADPRVVLKESGELLIGDAGPLEGKGVRLCSEEKGKTGVIGLTRECARPGVIGAPDDAVPPVRFREDGLIANCVAEEYQALRMWGLRPGGQGLVSRGGRHFDEQRVLRDGKETTIAFDITRFFGEMGLEP